MSRNAREYMAVALSTAIILALWVALLFALTGCAGAGMLRQAHDAGGGLGLALQHCSSYGPLKTTKATKSSGPKVKFGAAIVCEK